VTPGRSVQGMSDPAVGGRSSQPAQPKCLAAAVFAAGTFLVAFMVAPSPFAAATPDATSEHMSCAGGELDNCYHEDQMSDFVATGQQMVTGYLTQIGVPSESLPSLTYIPAGMTTVSQCVNQDGIAAQSDRAFDYCPADHGVYIGQGTVWDSYQKYGAAGPISALAHEYGHFLQAFADVPDPHTAAETIGHENQADCVSGAFIGYLDARGEVEYPEDFDHLGQFLTATASAEGPGRDHGTATERIRSFEQGYTGGLSACNRFYPATPLTT
jgi:predicted metalloprotease